MANEQPIHMRRVVYHVPGMEKVNIIRNLIYKTVDKIELKMDVYKPSDLSKESRLPAVVFIHGGPIASDFRPELKDWGQYLSYGELIAASGLVGVTFNHRFHSYTHLNQSASDVLAAIEYLRSHKELLNIDGDHICLWAISGGGLFLSIPLREKPSFIRSIVAYYALLDPCQIKQAYDEIRREELDKFSPWLLLRRNRPIELPIFIARAGKDYPEYKKSNDLFIYEALEANVNLNLINHPRGQHAFDILDDDLLSHWIISRTIEFVKSNI